MSNIILPSIDNSNLEIKSKDSNKIRTICLSHGSNRFKNYLHGNNNANLSKENLTKNTIKSNKFVTLKRNMKPCLKESCRDKNQIKSFWKNKTYLELENNKKINKKLILLLANKTYNQLNTENISVSNKNYNNFSINYNNEYNTTEKNTHYISKEHFKDLYNNDKPTSLNKKIHKIKDKKSNRELKIKEIVDSLINSTSQESQKEINNIKIKFPKEKSIDPFSYIKFNLQENPYNKAFNKGLKTIMTKMTDESLRKEYEKSLIQKAADVNNLKVDSNQFKAPLGEAKFYKNKFDDLINQTKSYKSFYFNHNFNSHKKGKMANYNLQRNNLEKTYKKYFENNFKLKKNIINNNKINKNNATIDINLEKNIDKYLSFDSRINNLLFISKKTEDYINRKSKEHEEMINKYNSIFDRFKDTKLKKE